MAAYKKRFSTLHTDMTIRSGIDIVDIPKFAENLKSKAFIRKVFTPAEISICEASPNPVKCYAGKFAVKEAFMKAIGEGIRQDVWFTQIEVLEEECVPRKITIQTQGRAKEILTAITGGNISVSISHSNDMVVASVAIASKS